MPWRVTGRREQRDAVRELLVAFDQVQHAGIAKCGEIGRTILDHPGRRFAGILVHPVAPLGLRDHMSSVGERRNPFAVDELGEPGDVIGVRVRDHGDVDLVARHARGRERVGSATDRLLPLAGELMSRAEVHEDRRAGDPDQRRVVRDLEVAIIVEPGSDLLGKLIDGEAVEHREQEPRFVRTDPVFDDEEVGAAYASPYIAHEPLR